MKKRGVLLISFLLFVSLSLVACIQGEQTLEEIDVPEESTIIEEDDELALETEEDFNNEEDLTEGEVSEESEETVLREIYLFDAEGFVVPQQMELPKTESAALTTMQYMVKDGPVTELLPNGFEAVLPANTEILGMNLSDDGTLVIDLSEEFTNYEAKDEIKILEAITHTMTQFDNIERIKLWINGEELSEMPVNGTPISSGYSVEKGINVFLEGKPNIQKSKAITVYYPKQYHDQFYHVPITRYFDATDEALYEQIIESVMGNPSFNLNVAQVFNDGAKLMEKPLLDKGVLQLVFNNAILKDETEGVIADEVMETIIKSVSALEEVEAVDVKVENKSTIVSESGVTYNRPVTLNDIKAEEKM